MNVLFLKQLYSSSVEGMVEHIWLLAGYAGSGKDTVGQLLLNLLGSQATMGSFAGAAKDAVAAQYNIPRHMLDTQEGKASLVVMSSGQRTVREILIEFAEGEKARTGNPSVWAERVEPPPTPHWILSDWRFLDELLHLRFRFPKASIHTLRIVRPSVRPSNSPTEHELESFLFEHTLDNSGSLLHLAKQIQIILDIHNVSCVSNMSTGSM